MTAAPRAAAVALPAVHAARAAPAKVAGNVVKRHFPSFLLLTSCFIKK